VAYATLIVRLSAICSICLKTTCLKLKPYLASISSEPVLPTAYSNTLHYDAGKAASDFAGIGAQSADVSVYSF
jgi:hypothetical protein